MFLVVAQGAIDMAGSSAASDIHCCMGSCLLLLYGRTSVKLEGIIGECMSVCTCTVYFKDTFVAGTKFSEISDLPH